MQDPVFYLMVVFILNIVTIKLQFTINLACMCLEEAKRKGHGKGAG